MIYSKTSEYALRALSYLGSKKDLASATILEVHRKTGVPQAYLAKVFQCLVHARILGSKCGPGGGFYFLIQPNKLTLMKVIESLDDASESMLSKCVMGQTECGEKNPCCLHEIWANARNDMYRILSKETIADLARLNNRTFWNNKRKDILSKRMQQVFGYGA